MQRKWLTKLIDAKPKVEHPSPWGDMNHVVGPLFGHVPPGVWERLGPRTQGWTMSPQRGYVLKQYRIPAGPGGHGRGHDFCWLILAELGYVWGPCPPSSVGWGDGVEGG